MKKYLYQSIDDRGDLVTSEFVTADNHRQVIDKVLDVEAWCNFFNTTTKQKGVSFVFESKLDQSKLIVTPIE